MGCTQSAEQKSEKGGKSKKKNAKNASTNNNNKKGKNAKKKKDGNEKASTNNNNNNNSKTKPPAGRAGGGVGTTANPKPQQRNGGVVLDFTDGGKDAQTLGGSSTLGGGRDAGTIAGVGGDNDSRRQSVAASSAHTTASIREQLLHAADAVKASAGPTDDHVPLSDKKLHNLRVWIDSTDKQGLLDPQDTVGWQRREREMQNMQSASAVSEGLTSSTLDGGELSNSTPLRSNGQRVTITASNPLAAPSSSTMNASTSKRKMSILQSMNEIAANDGAAFEESNKVQGEEDCQNSRIEL